MELFAELRTLYTQLVQDVTSFSDSEFRSNGCEMGDRNTGMQVLKTNLSNLQCLKDEMQQKVCDVSTESDLNDISSGCGNLIQFITLQLDALNIGLPSASSVPRPARGNVNEVNAACSDDISDNEACSCPKSIDVENPIQMRVAKTELPKLADFCISETTLHQLHIFNVDNDVQETEKPSTLWEKKSLAFHDLGNTIPTMPYPQLANISAFDYRNIGAGTADTPGGSRQDENSGPMLNVNVEQLNKTLLSLPPQAPMLSSVAQQFLK